MYKKHMHDDVHNLALLPTKLIQDILPSTRLLLFMEMVLDYLGKMVWFLVVYLIGMDCYGPRVLIIWFSLL
jgi:hypothetical protein